MKGSSGLFTKIRSGSIGKTILSHKQKKPRLLILSEEEPLIRKSNHHIDIIIVGAKILAYAFTHRTDKVN